MQNHHRRALGSPVMDGYLINHKMKAYRMGANKMLKLNWKLLLGLALVLVIMVSSGCMDKNSIEKYTLTVDIEGVESTPMIKVYDGEKEIDSKEGNSVQFELSSGSYTLEATADGYEVETREVAIDGSDEAISFTLSELSEWTLVWSDEFDEPTVDTFNWTRQKITAGTFNNEWQEYTDSPENCYIQMDADGDDGEMVIEAKYNGNGFAEGNFTSARMITNEKVEYQYGKIAAKIKVPEGQGIWPAFWMLGTNISETGGDTDWPWCGEIDIMEKIGGTDHKESTVHGTIHYAKDEDAPWPDCYDYIGESKTISEYLSKDYHVYEIEWNADTIIWRLDGEEYHRVDISSSEFDEFRQEFYMILNVAVGGDWPGYPDETTSFPQKMHIDWVRVYKNQ